MSVDQPLCHHFFAEGLHLFRNPLQETHIPLSAGQMSKKGYLPESADLSYAI